MELNETTLAIIAFLVLVIEFVLGRTKLVEANSSVELILNFIKGFAEKITKKKSE